ncbi:MAG: TauD/TfdA family dioxygenase [Actinomycetota bacterium]
MTIDFVPTGHALGAFVEGLNPDAIDPDAVSALHQGLFDHGVLIVRGAGIDAGQLVAIGRAFGELEILPEPEKRHPEHPEIFNLSNVRPDGELVVFEEPQAVFLRGTERWHTDSSFREVPALCTMLYAVEVPQRGGQTQFADMRQALRLLPPDDRAAMSDLRVVHSYEYSRANNPGRMDPMTDEERAKYPPVEHPWLRTHDDGSQSLYMGGHASHVVGWDPAVSRQRFAEIEAQLSVHDVVYEHRWQADDLLVWDNRTLLHRLLPYDIANERRVMRRVTVAGTTRPR